MELELEAQKVIATRKGQDRCQPPSSQLQLISTAVSHTYCNKKLEHKGVEVANLYRTFSRVTRRRMNLKRSQRQ